MIKTLSYTEVQKFHKDLAKRMLSELRSSDSENNSIPVENIQWAYSFETDGELDIRQRRVSIDRGIRREKLLKLDNNLRRKKEKNSIFSIFSSKEKESVDTISEELKDFFSKVVIIQLMLKIGDYERFERVEKTSLFESKIKEDLSF